MAYDKIMFWHDIPSTGPVSTQPNFVWIAMGPPLSPLTTRVVPIWVFGMYRYPIWIPPKEADKSIQYLHYKQKS